jgi:hypothetical protein
MNINRKRVAQAEGTPGLSNQTDLTKKSFQLLPMCQAICQDP